MLNSIEDVVLASLSIVLGTLVSTAVSVLRDRQEKIRCCMLREASLLDTLAQQLVKLFRYDKARLKRVTNVLERYVEDCVEIKFWTPHAISANRSASRRSTATATTTPTGTVSKKGPRDSRVVAECLDNQIAGPKYGFSPSSSTAAIYQCEVLVFELNQVRQGVPIAERVAAARRLHHDHRPDGRHPIYVRVPRRGDGLLRRNAEVPVGDGVRVLFSLTATSFFAIFQVLSDLADTYTGANEQFRVDAHAYTDGATFRMAARILDGRGHGERTRSCPILPIDRTCSWTTSSQRRMHSREAGDRERS